MKQISLYVAFIFLCVSLASGQKKKEAIKVDLFLLADNLGNIPTLPYDIDRMVRETIESLSVKGEPYDATLGVGVYHDEAETKFESLVPLIPISEYLENNYAMNSELSGDGGSTSADFAALSATIKSKDVDWREGAIRFVIWVGDHSNHQEPMKTTKKVIGELQAADVHIIAISTENTPVDGTTNQIVNDTEGAEFKSPNNDLNIPGIVSRVSETTEKEQDKEKEVKVVKEKKEKKEMGEEKKDKKKKQKKEDNDKENKDKNKDKKKGKKDKDENEVALPSAEAVEDNSLGSMEAYESYSAQDGELDIEEFLVTFED